MHKSWKILAGELAEVAEITCGFEYVPNARLIKAPEFDVRKARITQQPLEIYQEVLKSLR